MTSYRVTFDRPAELDPLHVAFVDGPHDRYVFEALLEHVHPLSPDALMQITIDAVSLTGTIGTAEFRDAGTFHLTVISEPDMTACRVCGCTDADCSACLALTGRVCSWVDDLTTAGRICSRCFVDTGVRTS